jgi:hypothetical protein
MKMKRKMFLIICIILLSIPLYAQRKTTTSQNVYSFTYIEFNDGCLVLSGNYHYRMGSYGAGLGGVRVYSRLPEHRNDNSVVRAEINIFNNEIKRLNAVTEDNQQALFNKTPIGSWYFVYRVSQRYDHRNYTIDLDAGIPTSETCVIYTLNVWRIDVVSAR